MRSGFVFLVLALALVQGAVAQVRTTDAVSPVLECTARNGENDYVGYWGYHNKTEAVISILYGNQNAFMPDPEIRGQPTIFKPGVQRFVVSVPHDRSPLTWRLGRGAETSSTAVAQRCQPVCAVPPFVVVEPCDNSVVIDGSASGTLNNNGVLTDFEWATNCPGTLSNTDSLTPTLTLSTTRRRRNRSSECRVTLTVTDDTRFGGTGAAGIETETCISRVQVKACIVDCAGIPNGATEIDQCGVCGGDGSSCLDCAGVPNGGNVVDQCGVCGGSNSTCIDCNGIPNGGAVLDSCGICGGDNSSCTDCNGVPNGGGVIDQCGICGGNNSSCVDCNGTPNGGVVIDTCGICGGDGSSCGGGCSSTIDQCGVCGGNNSTCRDCAGIINGGTTVDPCGVCGGDGTTCQGGGNCPGTIDQCGVCSGDNSSCTDCAGVIHGGSKIDACGVCGGDGSSCGVCYSFVLSVRPRIAVLQDFQSLYEHAVRYLTEAIACSPENRGEMRDQLERIQELRRKFIALLNVIFRQPGEVCSAEICKSGLVGKYKKLLRALANTLLDASIAAQRVVATCREPIESRGAVRGARGIHSEILADIAALPDGSVICQ